MVRRLRATFLLGRVGRGSTRVSLLEWTLFLLAAVLVVGAILVAVANVATG